MKLVKKEVYIILFAVLAVILIGESLAEQSLSSANSNLIIWTAGTLSQENKTFSNNLFGGQKTSEDWNFHFYSNYTNYSGAPIHASNGNGNCNISFNETGILGDTNQMEYNSSSLLWQINKSFNYKGNLSFFINCTSDLDNLSIGETFRVRNSDPRKWDSSISYSFSEDSLSFYDFSKNVTDDDFNDLPLNYIIKNISSDHPYGSNLSQITWITINSSGSVLISANNSNQNGTFYLGLEAADSGEIGSVPISVFKVFQAHIGFVNDAPIFNNLNDSYFNISTSADPYVFEYIINITDEEDNYPFELNISFLNCSGVGNWSSRNCSTSAGRELFNSSQFTFNATTGILNISFSPSRNDVGNYTINFSVWDLNNQIAPYNNSRSQLVYFNVLNRNTPPSFVYLCEDSRNGTEDVRVRCYVNATDIEELNNVTYSTNYNWFIFNDTGLNYSSGNITQISNASSNFSSHAVIDFLPGDRQVGNWFINFTLIDTGTVGDSYKQYSEIINISIANLNDSPLIYPVANLTGSSSLYSSGTYGYSINASDDDLLIPNKSIYNESLTFTANVSWINFTILSAGFNESNFTLAIMNIYPNQSLLGDHGILINISDSTNLSVSQILSITILNNSAPFWGNFSTNISETEGDRIFVNLSSNLSDADAQPLNFSFFNFSYFPSFSLNSTSGIINFTTADQDVGEHILIVNVSDGFAQASLTFNFTVYNLNEAPSIVTVYDPWCINISVNSTTWFMNTSEDANVTIKFGAEDGDFNIIQKAFYNESLNVSTTLTKGGLASNLFAFRVFGQQTPAANTTTFIANFITNKSYVGNYTVLVNISDRSGLSDSRSFNLSISEVLHPPVFDPFENFSKALFDEFILDVNVSDLEDGQEYAGSNNANFTYRLVNLTAGGNFLLINATDGRVANSTWSYNFSLDPWPYAGSWLFNISVRDSFGLNSSRLFSLKVYDTPIISSPLENYEFNFTENLTSVLNFTVTHSVADNLNYSIYIDGILKNSSLGAGNGSTVYLNITPGFEDETCNRNVTLLLNVSNAKSSNSSSWNLTINHNNYPLRKILDISYEGLTNITQYSPFVLSLKNFYEDLDTLDACHYQNIRFAAVNASNQSLIRIGIVNWTNVTDPSITFSSNENASESYYLIVMEIDESNTSNILNLNLDTYASNNFTINLIENASVASSPDAGTSVNAPGGGSGSGSSGGGTTATPAEANPKFLKILLPDPVSIEKDGKIILPISLINEGEVELKEITLHSAVSINGSLASNISAYFDNDFTASLKPGERRNFTLSMDVDTDLEGLYEITVNASVNDPEYSDWGKIYMNVKKGQSIKEKFIFIDELMVSNPECAEIKELVNSARESLEKGDLQNAETLITDAISACRNAISQKPNPTIRKLSGEDLLSYASVGAVIFFLLGAVYYLYRRGKFMKEMSLDEGLKSKKV